MSKHQPHFRPGNPLSLSFRLHVFPRKSIKRFANTEGQVETLLPSGGRFAHPNDPMFWADRGWDHGTEHGLMKRIETAFEAVVDCVLKGVRGLSTEQNKAVTRFWWLWRERYRLQHNPATPFRSPLHVDCPSLSVEQKETLEANGVFYGNGLEIPAPQAAGLTIMYRMCWLAGQPTLQWGVITSEQIDFLVPDTFGPFTIVPIAPRVCLLGGHQSHRADRGAALEINEEAVRQCSRYVFARSIRDCFPAGFFPLPGSARHTDDKRGRAAGLGLVDLKERLGLGSKAGQPHDPPK